MKTDEPEAREIDRLRARVAELETERRRLAALVESSPVGVLVVDAEIRTLAWVNQEAERILGMSPEPGTSLEKEGEQSHRQPSLHARARRSTRPG